MAYLKETGSHLDSHVKSWFCILAKENCLSKLYSMNPIKHIISKISPAGYHFSPSAEKIWVINICP